MTASGRAHEGLSQFTVAINPQNDGVVLRRLFDQGIGNQQAEVFVNGAFVGLWYRAGTNGTNRWREDDFSIPAALTSGVSNLQITVQFVSSDLDWNEFAYTAFSMVP